MFILLADNVCLLSHALIISMFNIVISFASSSLPGFISTNFGNNQGQQGFNALHLLTNYGKIHFYLKDTGKSIITFCIYFNKEGILDMQFSILSYKLNAKIEIEQDLQRFIYENPYRFVFHLMQNLTYSTMIQLCKSKCH